LMLPPLLVTKTSVPRLRSGLVKRPDLIKRFAMGLDYPLTLVSAPAGYGKTTLLAELATHLPAAWLSLDEEDNDTVRFWTHIIAALQKIVPRLEGLQSSLMSFELPMVRPLLSELVNELSKDDLQGRPFYLILDDYHLIEEKAIHKDLAFLLEHLPEQVRLIISTRSDPPLPLAKIRSRGMLREFRTQELRFSVKEIETIFNGVMGLGLSREHIAALEARTEGWIASLQMAALSMQKHCDIPAFIRAFTGTNRYILDYLTEEVLNQQTESDRSFLMETSILHQMSGPLCDAVTGRYDGQEMLRKLETANMFLVSLDNERQWYRYHRLFASLLFGNLRERRPERINELNIRAARWLSQNGFEEEAVSHALAAGDHELAARLMQQTFQGYTYRYELYTILKRLAKLPVEIIEKYPRLGLYYAFIYSFTGKIDEAENWLKRVEGKASSRGDMADIAVIRANIAMARRDDAAAVEILRTRFEEKDEPSVTDTSLDVNANLNSKLVAGFILSHMYKAKGNLYLAIETGLKLLEVFKGIPPEAPQRVFLAWPHIALAEFLYEQNQLDGALRHATAAEETAGRFRHKPLQAWALVILDLVRQAGGKQPGERDSRVLEEAAREDEREDEGEIVCYTSNTLALMVRARYARGDLRSIIRCVRNFERIANPGRFPQVISVDFNDSYDVAVAYSYLAQGKLAEAGEKLKDLREIDEKAGRHGNLIEILLLQALAAQAGGDAETAVDLIGRAVAIAEPNGYIRIFLDMGPSMMNLLKEAARRGVSLHYVRRLLAEFEKARPERAAPIEPLTPRELEILKLLAGGLSNREIARKLVVSPGTVKSHTHHIYAKLGVGTRTRAIRSAADLDLL
jgi:LuxR family maltose regulon positive regulatory protein